jgi:hypothetical protein
MTAAAFAQPEAGLDDTRAWPEIDVLAAYPAQVREVPGHDTVFARYPPWPDNSQILGNRLLGTPHARHQNDGRIPKHIGVGRRKPKTVQRILFLIRQSHSTSHEMPFLSADALPPTNVSQQSPNEQLISRFYFSWYEGLEP